MCACCARNGKAIYSLSEYNLVMPAQKGSASELSPEYVILGLIAQRAAHGYELHQRLMETFGFIWRISQSQAYAIIARLERKGEITSRTVRQVALPTRHPYQLTHTGRHRFRQWLFADSPCSSRAIRIEFTTRLYFVSALYPDKVSQVLQSQMQKVTQGKDQIVQTLAEFEADDVFNRFALDLRVRQLDTILGWLHDYEKALTDSTLK